VQVEWDGNYGRVGHRRDRVERNGETLQDVGGEEVAAMSGEVVVDGETALRVERLCRGRLHDTTPWTTLSRRGGPARRATSRLHCL